MQKFTIQQLILYCSGEREGGSNALVFIEGKYHSVADLRALGRNLGLHFTLNWVSNSSLTTMHLSFN